MRCRQSSALVAFARYKQEPVTGPVRQRRPCRRTWHFVLSSGSAGPGCGAPRPGGRDRGFGEGMGSPGGPRVRPRGPSGGRGGGIVPDGRPEGAAGDLGPHCHADRAGRDGVRGAGGRAPPGAPRRPAARGGRLPDRVAAGHPPAHGGEGPAVSPREQERGARVCWPWAVPHSIVAPPPGRAGAEPPIAGASLTDRPVCPEFQTVRFAPLAQHRRRGEGGRPALPSHRGERSVAAGIGRGASR